MIKSARLMPKNINSKDKIITVSLIPTDPIASVGLYCDWLVNCSKLIRSVPCTLCSKIPWGLIQEAHNPPSDLTPFEHNLKDLNLAQWPIHKIYRL